MNNFLRILLICTHILGVFPAFAGSVPARQVKVIAWEKVAEWPHDVAAFTQGLEMWGDSYFLESIGQYGRSEIRKVAIKTGKVVASGALDSKYFAEGATRIGADILQLTWREGVVFKWSGPKYFARKSILPNTFKGEGWGITKGDKSLWISNGTSEIQELDSRDLTFRRAVSVSWNGNPVEKLNELEFINGKIFANIWMSTIIVRFSPASGIVDGVIDINDLLPAHMSPDAVANGIAWNPATNHLYVTGKNWPKVIELKLKD